MKTVGELLDFYKNQLMPDLLKLEEQRKEVARKLITYIAPIAVFTLVLLSAMRHVKDGPGLILALGVMACMGIYYVVSKKYVNNFKDLVISRMVSFIDPSLKYSKTDYIPCVEFEKSKVSLTRPNRYKGDDRVQGTIGQTQVDFSELLAQYESGSGKNRSVQTLFKGLFFKADFNKHFKGRTFVLPDMAERRLGALGKMFQKMSVGRPPLVKLEDPEFEREFVVYATDQIESRYILSPSLMRRIVDFKKKSKRKIYLSFIDSSVYVAICYTKNLFEPRIFQTLINFSPVQQYFEDLQIALSIVEDLNLNTRIWSKA